MLFNVREKIRTPDTLVRSQVLYPAELRTHNWATCNLYKYIKYLLQRLLFYLMIFILSSNLFGKNLETFIFFQYEIWFVKM